MVPGGLRYKKETCLSISWESCTREVRKPHPAKRGSAFKTCKLPSPCWHVFGKHVCPLFMHTICIVVGTEKCTMVCTMGSTRRCLLHLGRHLEPINFSRSNRHIWLPGIVDGHCDIHSWTLFCCLKYHHIVMSISSSRECVMLPRPFLKLLGVSNECQC